MMPKRIDTSWMDKREPRDEVGRMTDEEIAQAKEYWAQVVYLEASIRLGDISLFDALNDLEEYAHLHPSARALWERWDYYYGEW